MKSSIRFNEIVHDRLGPYGVSRDQIGDLINVLCQIIDELRDEHDQRLSQLELKEASKRSIYRGHQLYGECDNCVSAEDRYNEKPCISCRHNDSGEGDLDRWTPIDVDHRR